MEKDIIKQEKYQVRNYSYNGFIGQSRNGFAPWTIDQVIGWTNDPGILCATGTDGKTHYIPTYCISQELLDELPVAPILDPYNGSGVLFGTPDESILNY